MLHDRYYFAARAAEHWRLAKSAKSQGVRAIHLDMAATYDTQAEAVAERWPEIDLDGKKQVASKQQKGVLMPSERPPTNKPFTIFSSAADEAAAKVAADESVRRASAEQCCDNEGGHMSGTSGRVKHRSGSKLPFVVRLTHHESEPTERAFATMREAEAYIKRNTPVARAVLATTYDRPASEPRRLQTDRIGAVHDEHIRERLKLIDQRLRRISTEDAVSALASGLVNAGLHEDERLQLIAEIERILDQLDGKASS